MSNAALVIELERAFRFAGLDHPDPDPIMELDEVLDHYTNIYSKLLGGKIVDRGIEGDQQIFEMVARYGDKG